MIPLKDENPTERFPIVTVVLITACVLVFLWQTSLVEPTARRALYILGLVPAVLFDIKQLPPELAVIPPYATLFTSMFLHGGWMHLIGNMLFLWIFGNNVEDALGRGRFILFYLVCGLVAALAQAAPAPESTIPVIGASGAIAGVLAAYLLLYPHARVVVLIPIFFYLHLTVLPAFLLIGLWFLIQVLNSVAASGQEGGVAWLAHVGGFVAGILLLPLLRRRGVRLLQGGR